MDTKSDPLQPLKAIAKEHKRKLQAKAKRKPRKKTVKIAPPKSALTSLPDDELNKVCDDEVLLDRELGERSLRDFAKMCWPYMDGTRNRQKPYIETAWHSECLADHIQAVIEGDIKKLLISVPPGHGKPVSENTEILMGDGQYLLLKDIRVGDEVITHKGIPAKVLDVYKQGEKDCLKITTQSGREVVAAEDHPFLTPEGWVNAKDLILGQCLGLPAKVETTPYYERSNEEMRLIGYLIGDGCTVSSNLNITGIDEEELEDIEVCAKSLGFGTNTTLKNGVKKNVWNVRLKGAKKWAQAVGIDETLSADKTIPNWVYLTSKENIANLLGAYFACDGTVNAKERTASKDLYVEFYSVSKELLLGTQKLLFRLGLHSKLYYKKVRYKRHKASPVEYRDSWRLSLVSKNLTSKFVRMIPVHHSEKKRRLCAWGTVANSFSGAFIADQIKNIEAVGKKVCSCLRVYRDSTFLANDLVVHNSSYAAVFGPVWAWINNPAWKMVFGSYSYANSKRDSGYCVNLIESEWWKKRWGHKFVLTKKDTLNVRTSMGGNRELSSIEGRALGIRADLVVADDPLNIKEVDSELARSNVHLWWNPGMRTRGDKDLRELVIMQRLHDFDLCGYLQSEVGGYQELVLPAEYIPSRKCVTFTEDGTKFWEDPRKKEGELLFPEKFDRKLLDGLRGKDDKSRNMYAAMQQQDPVQPGGNIVKTEWFRYYDISPEKQYQECTKAILSCDLAVKAKKTSSFSVIQIWGIRRPNIYLIDQLRRRLNFVGQVQAVKMMVDKWNSAKGPHLSDKLIEDKATGSPVTEMLQNEIQGLILFDGNDDKEERMSALTWLWQAGNIYVPGKVIKDVPGKVDFSHVPWMDIWKDEITRYPKAAFTDQAVTMSQALLHISRQMKTVVGMPTSIEGAGYMYEMEQEEMSNSYSRRFR